MNRNTLKNITCCAVFCVLVLSMISQLNEILLNKANNRYYILEDFIEEQNEEYDVHVYGSCHAYTSFNPTVFTESFGVTSYVFANPGEIIPTTYLRMMERFKEDAPDVALIDIWGLNAYETYSTWDRIFNLYMPVNIELIPLSPEKIEVIRDYGSLDMLLENFAIAKYKDRIMGMELTNADFDYSFAEVLRYSEGYVKNEMTLRRNNNGYAAYNAEKYTKHLTDYEERQAQVAGDEQLAFEDDIIKYVEKIIELCEAHDVEVIFYRAPYISRENELRKANWFSGYCRSKDIPYLDLEQLVDFDYSSDFMDYYHLNVNGAEKSTLYLAPYILEAMKK